MYSIYIYISLSRHLVGSLETGHRGRFCLNSLQFPGSNFSRWVGIPSEMVEKLLKIISALDLVDHPKIGGNSIDIPLIFLWDFDFPTQKCSLVILDSPRSPRTHQTTVYADSYAHKNSFALAFTVSLKLMESHFVFVQS